MAVPGSEAALHRLVRGSFEKVCRREGRNEGGQVVHAGKSKIIGHKRRGKTDT